jgi:hypothetical protein
LSSYHPSEGRGSTRLKRVSWLEDIRRDWRQKPQQILEAFVRAV